jgi:hypothetical protein
LNVIEEGWIKDRLIDPIVIANAKHCLIESVVFDLSLLLQSISGSFNQFLQETTHDVVIILYLVGCSGVLRRSHEQLPVLLGEFSSSKYMSVEVLIKLFGLESSGHLEENNCLVLSQDEQESIVSCLVNCVLKTYARLV